MIAGVAGIAGVMLPSECAAADAGVRAMLAAAELPGVTSTTWAAAGVGLGEQRRPARAGSEGNPSQERTLSGGARGACPLASKSPLAGADGLAIAAWARLDDRRALASTLGVSHCVADRELILCAYRRWGVECPRHLLGDYAFAIFDGRRQRLFCARDHAGVRPLYYAQAKSGFVFASAVESVLAGPGVDPRLDDATVATYLKFVGWGTGTASRTFFRAVRMLPAGHSLVVDRGRHAVRPRLWRHWVPENAPTLAPAAAGDFAAAFLDLYATAVRERLAGDDAVGVHLSGGLDSSSIAVLASRELRRQGRPPPAAFSWLPAPTVRTRFASAAAALEFGLVEATASQEGLTVQHARLEPDEFFGIFVGGDAVHPWAHNLLDAAVQRQAAALGTPVLLSGFGGDQAISSSGRGHYAKLLQSGRWREFGVLARAREKRRPARVAADALLAALPDDAQLRHSLRQLRRRLLQQPVKPGKHFLHPALAALARSERSDAARDVRQEQLARLQDFRLRVRLEPEAASGARRGVEYRYPLLDRRILEFALGLPPQMYLGVSASRLLMRLALGSRGGGAEPLLPPVVRWNESKRDNIHWQAYTDAFVASLPAFRERLAGGTPSRSAYVDMPRLLAWLDADRFRCHPRLEGISRALLFLDL